VLSPDTNPTVEALQIQVQRAMTGEQRLIMAAEMSSFARELGRERLKAEHPEWSDSQIRHELIRLTFLPGQPPQQR